MTGSEEKVQELVKLAKYVKRKNKELGFQNQIKLEVDPDIVLMMVNAITNKHKQAVAEVVELLTGERGAKYAFSRYEETKCSKNDAHLTRYDWAKFIVKEMG